MESQQSISEELATTDTAPPPVLPMLWFTLGAQQFAIAAASIREIARYRPWTPVPGSQRAIPGIISQYGTIFPVVDLREMLGLPNEPPTPRSRLVLIRQDDTTLALLVESVIDLIEVPHTQLIPAHASLSQARWIQSQVQLQDDALAVIDLKTVIAMLRLGTG